MSSIKQADISRVIGAKIAGSEKPWAVAAREQQFRQTHTADFEQEWGRHGSTDPAMARVKTRSLATWLREERAATARAAEANRAAGLRAEQEFRNLIAVQAEVGRLQGRSLAAQEHAREVTRRLDDRLEVAACRETAVLGAALDRRAAAAQKRQAAYHSGRSIFGGFEPRGHQRIVY